MRLNLDSFDDIKYVDSNVGKDITDAGSKNNPYKTITYCISQITLDNTLIILSKGIHDVNTINSMSISNKELSYLGQDINTTIRVSTCSNSFNYKTNFYNCVIKPSDTLSGDNRFIYYYADNYEINFYNCLFLNSDNGTYPTSWWFQFDPSSPVYRNKNFYNCSFVKSNAHKQYPNNAAYDTASSCYGKYINCACVNSYFNFPINNTYLLDSVTNVNYDNKYKLTNVDNKLYGVYSGEYAWVDIKLLIFKDNKYYSIKQDHYDISTKEYISIDVSELTEENIKELYGFNIDELFQEITINNKTFKPIDKFDNFQLVSNNNFKCTLSAIKSKKEMIIGSNYIETKIANNIDYFKHIYSIDNNCSIKVAIDNGTGIKYTSDNGETWINSSLILPNKLYEELTPDELINWNNIMEEIYNNGFDISETENINFNNIITKDNQKTRFLYVIEITSTKDTCNTSKLDWQFDSIGSFLQLDKEELQISMSNNNISLKALKDIDILKVNIVSS